MRYVQIWLGFVVGTAIGSLAVPQQLGDILNVLYWVALALLACRIDDWRTSRT